jgi:hypothetical protein
MFTGTATAFLPCVGSAATSFADVIHTTSRR